MRTPSPAPTCSLAQRRRLLLVAGFTVPLALAGSIFAAGPAFADTSSDIPTKAALSSAFGAAAAGSTIALDADLTGDGGSDDVLDVPTEATLDLAGHELDLDQIVVESGVALTVIDSVGTGSLVVGGSVSAPAVDATGIDVDGGTFVAGAGAHVATTGSDGHAGIGATSAAYTQIDIETGATVVAQGGARASGIGGDEGASPATVNVSAGSTVTATGGVGGAGIGAGAQSSAGNNVILGEEEDEDESADDTATAAVVHATGGAGAAGIGGGEGGNDGYVSIQNATVTAVDGGLSDDAADGTTGPSAIGGGAGDTSQGQLYVSQNGRLIIPQGSDLQLSSSWWWNEDQNQGVIELDGSLTGGSLQNYGTVLPRTADSIAPGVVIDGNNYEVQFDLNGGAGDVPATAHVYAPSLAEGAFDITKYSGTSGEKQLLGFDTAADGTGTALNGAERTPLSSLAAPPSGDPIFVGPVLDRQAISSLDDGASDGSTSIHLYAQYGQALTVPSAALPDALLGARYDKAIPATGDGIQTYELQSDVTLPAGLQLNETTGHLTGYPAEPGHYTIPVTVTSRYEMKTATLTLDIAGAPVFATDTLPDATAGTEYSVPIVATGSGEAIAYSVVGGALPAGLSLDPGTGVLSGTPTTGGSAVFVVKATSRFGTTKAALSVAVAAAAATTSSPNPSTATTSAPTASEATTSTPAPSTATTSAPSPAASSTPSPASTSAPSPAASTTTAPSPSTTSQPSPSSADTTAAAPQLPVVGVRNTKLGHQFRLSVAASSTSAVHYSIAKGSLPKGLKLDAKHGLISGVALKSGRFSVTIQAANADSATTHAYAIVVPELEHLITASPSTTTPKSGRAVTVAVRGLKAHEHWTIALDGEVVAKGIAKHAGTVHHKVSLTKTAVDVEHTIRVASSQTVTDPAKSTAAAFSVTSLGAKKHLLVTGSTSAVFVRGLASGERITVKVGTRTIAKGHADADGTFAASISLKSGHHTLVAVGSSAQRTGRLVVKAGD